MIVSNQYCVIGVARAEATRKADEWRERHGGTAEALPDRAGDARQERPAALMARADWSRPLPRQINICELTLMLRTLADVRALIGHFRKRVAKLALGSTSLKNWP